MPIALKNQIKQYDIFIQKENVHPPSLSLPLHKIPTNPTSKDNPLFSVSQLVRTCIKGKNLPHK